MEILKKRRWFLAILGVLVTILVYRFVHSMRRDRQLRSVIRRNSSLVKVFFSNKKKGEVDTDSGSSGQLTAQTNLMSRTPAILENGRVTVVDYETFPNDDTIECVPHHAAMSACQICIMPTVKDALISGALRTKAGWEPQITGLFKQTLTDCPDCQVLDFGSNLGVYALIGASANRRVYAVEPMHENLMHLVKSVRVNGWEKRITIINNTLSNVYEELEFWRPWSNAGGSIPRKVGEPAPDKKLYDGPYDKVSSVQIDNLLEVIDFNKAVMKIDVEGYEPRAFTGASRFLAQMDIPVIFMEWSNKATDKLALKMAIDLTRMGYKVYDTAGNRLRQPSVEVVKN